MNDLDAAIPHARFRFRLIEAVSLVVGYALAALLLRSRWTAPGLPEPAELAALAVVYGWLGLVMSGPLLLLSPSRGSVPSGRTRAESAWAFVGGYWIGLTLLLEPLSWAMAPALAVPPLVYLAGRRLAATRPTPPSPKITGWTHPAAIGLLACWPIVWGLMIFLAHSIAG